MKCLELFLLFGYTKLITNSERSSTITSGKSWSNYSALFSSFVEGEQKQNFKVREGERSGRKEPVICWGCIINVKDDGEGVGMGPWSHPNIWAPAAPIGMDNYYPEMYEDDKKCGTKTCGFYDYCDSSNVCKHCSRRPCANNGPCCTDFFCESKYKKCYHCSKKKCSAGEACCPGFQCDTKRGRCGCAKGSASCANDETCCMGTTCVEIPGNYYQCLEENCQSNADCSHGLICVNKYCVPACVNHGSRCGRIGDSRECCKIRTFTGSCIQGRCEDSLRCRENRESCNVARDCCWTNSECKNGKCAGCLEAGEQSRGKTCSSDSDCCGSAKCRNPEGVGKRCVTLRNCNEKYDGCAITQKCCPGFECKLHRTPGSSVVWHRCL